MRDTAGSHLPKSRTLSAVPALAGLLYLAIIPFAPARIAVHADEAPSGPPSDRVTERDRQFWSFQKLARPTLPRVTATSRIRTPVDALILAPLEEQGLSISPDADRQ